MAYMDAPSPTKDDTRWAVVIQNAGSVLVQTVYEGEELRRDLDADGAVTWAIVKDGTVVNRYDASHVELHGSVREARLQASRYEQVRAVLES